jgi:hypothetical protein
MSAYPWLFSSSPSAIVEDETGAGLCRAVDGFVDPVAAGPTPLVAGTVDERTRFVGAGGLALPGSAEVSLGAVRYEAAAPIAAPTMIAARIPGITRRRNVRRWVRYTVGPPYAPDPAVRITARPPEWLGFRRMREDRLPDLEKT